jgi:hypothetical protein
MDHPAVRFLLRLALFLAVTAASTWAVAAAWTAIGGEPVSIHGWIAMGLGVSCTIGLAWILMRLAFRSDREGWDAEANIPGDPADDVRRR